MIDRANETLDDKAGKLIQSASLIVALAGLLSSPLVGASLKSQPLVFVLPILIAFMLMVVLSILAISPTIHYLPGTQGWQSNYDQYVLKSPEDSFKQLLSDSVETIDLLGKLNARKARLVRVSAYLLLFQILALVLFVSVMLP